MISTHTSVFLYRDEDAKFSLDFMDTGTLALSVGNHVIFMTQEQVKQLISAIGEVYWELTETMELHDPEEEYDEDNTNA